MALRSDLKRLGIADGLSRRYRRSDIREYLNTTNGHRNNFLYGNNYNIGKTVRALNKVYALGGKIEKFWPGGIIKNGLKYV
jgi:hypothetical protein